MKSVDLRTVEIEAKVLIRKRAIDLIKNGYSQKEVAEILGASQNTISTWNKNYKQLGAKGLKEKLRGRKKGEKRILSLKQETSIQNLIIDKMPDQLKLPYALWTRKAITELIKTKFNLTILSFKVEFYTSKA